MSDTLPEGVLKEISAQYELGESIELKPVYIGLDNRSFLVDTAGEKFFLQISNTPYQPHLVEHKTKLLDWLATQGLSECVAPMPTASGQLFFQLENIGVVVLFPARSQQNQFSDDVDADRQAGISLAGWIARLHNLTAHAPVFSGKPKETLIENFKVLETSFTAFQKISHTLPTLPLDDETQYLCDDFIEKSVQYYQVLFEDQNVYRLLHASASHLSFVHNDLNLSNLSFDDSGQLVTVYDFDNAGRDNRVADLQFIYYYYYHPSAIAGNDWFDIPKVRNAIAIYESATQHPVTMDEKRLCAMLGMDRSLRGLLWMFDMLIKGMPPEILSGVDARVRPNKAGEPGSPLFQTFAKLFNGIDSFSNTDLYLDMA